MLYIAIVDDEQSAFLELRNLLEKFFENNNVSFNIVWHQDVLTFLEEYRKADIVFMDVEMPLLNGIKAAEKLRRIDSQVPLIFVTNMAQYAINGYSVNAIDYVLKPGSYARISSLMKKMMRTLLRNTDESITVKASGSVKTLYLSNIVYIEVINHLLVYHTETEEIKVWGTLKEIKKLLPSEIFVQCHQGYIVNIKHIVSVDKEGVILLRNGETINISRNKKKEFWSVYSPARGIKWRNI